MLIVVIDHVGHCHTACGAIDQLDRHAGFQTADLPADLGCGYTLSFSRCGKALGLDNSHKFANTFPVENWIPLRLAPLLLPSKSKLPFHRIIFMNELSILCSIKALARQL